MSYIDHIRDDQENTIDLYSKLLANVVANQYNKTKPYQEGEYVINHPYLYKSRVDQPASERFVSTNWERVTIEDMVWDIARRVANG